MNTGRFATPGKTRSCPHCKATILDSATVCPGCNHHLRFDSASVQRQPALTPLRVEGILRHPASGPTWEYSVVLTIRNGRGQEVARQVVGVGALHPADERVFTLAVEVFKPDEVKEPKPETPARAPEARAPEARRPGQPAPVTTPRPTAPLPAAASSGRFTPPPPPLPSTVRPLPPSGAPPPPPRSPGLSSAAASAPTAPRATGGESKPQPKRS
jgi:hypothetical protein